MRNEVKLIGLRENRLLKTTAQIALAFIALCLSTFVFAQAGTGGLNKATSAANEWKTWAYGFLGVVVFLFLMYHVVLALMQKQSWMDVLSALAQVAAAGGVLGGAAWAWSIWGT